jgi:Coenzyme PQQ synthesis protein D (PqqD)
MRQGNTALDGVLVAAAEHEPVSALSARVRIPQSVVFRGFVHETVVLNLDTGRYHGLNPTGGRMLEVLRGGGSIGDAAVTLAAEFGVALEELQRDLLAFCENLASRGLLVIEPS